MEQVQQALPTGAVLTEVIRLAQAVDRHAPDGYSAHVLRIVRDSVAPGLTTAVWREWVPNGRIAARAEREEREAEQRRRAVARQAEILSLLEAAGTVSSWRQVGALRALFDANGYYIESYADSNAQYIAHWEVYRGQDIEPALAGLRAMAAGQAQPTLPGTDSKPAPAPVVDESEDEDPGCAHDGRVACDECDGTGCGGFNRLGSPNDCDTSCPHCTDCEHEHACNSCGLDPKCSHEFRCAECDQYVTWERDHWDDR
jgi:hypothetical protein